MEADRKSEQRLEFTTDELHLFQEAVLVVNLASEPTALYDERQWKLLCSCAVVFANAFLRENDGQKRMSHMSSGTSGENDFGGAFTANVGLAANTWKLYAKPPSINIDRRMLLSSTIGSILENRGLMGYSLLFLVAMNMGLEYFAPVSDTVYVRTLQNGDRIFALKRCSASILILHITSRIVFAILLAHRINRQILLTSFLFFETVVSTGALLLAHLVWIANCAVLAQDMYTVQTLVEDCLLLVCNLPIFIFASATDSLRFGLLSKIMLVVIVCAHLATSWIRTRCLNDAWGDPINCENFSSEGFSPRELFLMACTQYLVFFMQGLLKQVFGNEFAILHPCYRFCRSRNISSSSYHGLSKVGCCISAESTEIETLISRMKSIGFEGFETNSSYDEAIAQTPETHHVVHKLRPLLVQILNSAWSENIPLNVQFTQNDFSEVSSGRSSVKSSCGASHLRWHLRSDPAKLELSRAAILNSRIGTKLHERRLMGRLSALLGFLAVLLYIFMPFEEIRQGDITYPHSTWLGRAIFITIFFMCMVLVQHNMNRDLLALTCRRFETWVLSISSLIKSVLSFHQICSVFPFRDVGFDAFLWCFVVGLSLSLHANVIDCWRFSRRTRISLYFCLNLHFIYEFYVHRCERTYWKLPINCSLQWREVDGFRLREIYLGLLVSCLLFFVKALHRHLAGQVLAVWHPQYCLRSRESAECDSAHALDDSLSFNIGKQESEDLHEKENDYSDNVEDLHDRRSPIMGKHENVNPTLVSDRSTASSAEDAIEEESFCANPKVKEARVVPEKFSL